MHAVKTEHNLWPEWGCWNCEDHTKPLQKTFAGNNAYSFLCPVCRQRRLASMWELYLLKLT